MKIMNSFITGNMQTMATFVDRLASPPPSSKPLSSSPSRDLSLEHLDLLYTQCTFLKEKIYKKWGVLPADSDAQGDAQGEVRAARVERALAMYPHHKKKTVVVDTVQHEIGLRAVHKELKQRVESAEKRARAQSLAASGQSACARTGSRSSTPTPGLARSESPAPGARAEPSAHAARPESPSPNANANGHDEVAKLIEEVVQLRAALDAERTRSRALEERVIAEEKKIEKEAEAKFHREYKSKVQLVKDTLDMLKQHKDLLMARPDLAAEFKSLRLGPG